jgi:hypothetical protein
MISVSMADDHIFDVARIEAEFGQAFEDLGSVAQAKFVSMIMSPALVCSAQEEC